MFDYRNVMDTLVQPGVIADTGKGEAVRRRADEIHEAWREMNFDDPGNSTTYQPLRNFPFNHPSNQGM